jgi:hypothetical protein
MLLLLLLLLERIEAFKMSIPVEDFAKGAAVLFEVGPWGNISINIDMCVLLFGAKKSEFSTSLTWRDSSSGLIYHVFSTMSSIRGGLLHWHGAALGIDSMLSLLPPSMSEG